MRDNRQNTWYDWSKSMQASTVRLTLEKAAEREGAEFSDIEADVEHVADFEETHAPGGPRRDNASPERASGERASERASETLPPKKTRMCEPHVGGFGDVPSAQSNRLSALALHIPRDTEFLALSERERGLLPGSPSSCSSGVCVAAWVGCLDQPGRSWPYCFDQTSV